MSDLNYGRPCHSSGGHAEGIGRAEGIEHAEEVKSLVTEPPVLEVPTASTQRPRPMLKCLLNPKHRDNTPIKGQTLWQLKPSFTILAHMIITG